MTRWSKFSLERWPTRVGLVLLCLAGGTALTVIGSSQAIALLVLLGVAMIIAGLGLLRPVAKRILEWMDRRGL